MAFDSLSEKITGVFKRLKNKGKLSESDVKAAMREVRMALLEADVNYKVAKEFTQNVTDRAVGEKVMESLTPAQMVIKIVNEELVSLMGGESARIEFSSKPPTIIMLCGLQGSGKTTHAGKLAKMLKAQNHRPLLVACDIYRPAAIKQLQVNGEKQEVEVFTMGDQKRVTDIARAAVAYAEKNGHNVVILDTAGRLHIDEDMMAELQDIKANLDVHQSLLVVDAMTGQDAVNVAQEFDSKVGIDGVILTKMDGDTRGGAALSVKAVTGKPILYVGMGEKLSDLEQFYPDRMANRILGMGDILTLIEKAQAEFDEEKEKKMASHMKKGKFDFDDYLESMRQMKKMGGLASIVGMLPGMGAKMGDLSGQIDEKQLARTEAIVLSMTKEERSNPKLLNPQRKHRIAK
ncbi:MAG: signal recognition particle protein, partial [Oscillospiraceae bacterium]|nr:signal recognition particle protein [Oscillospiraceae bacterium]